jgi:flagellar assembly protein FliH
MSSKVLSGLIGTSSTLAISPMVWRQASARSHAPPGAAAEFRPGTSIASSEVAALLTRIAEMDRASRAEVADAYQKGQHEGEANARTQAQAALQPVLSRMVQTTRELCDLRPRLRREAEGDVVKLALAIARRIIHRELSIDPSAMQALVQVALGRLDRQEIHRVTVHPSQAAAVKASLAGESRQVEVISDPNAETGSLLFDTNHGKLDASVSAQFEEIDRGLTDRVNQR